MKRWLTALGALAMTNIGCTNIVLDPVDPGTTDAGATPTALAIRAGEWVPPAPDFSPLWLNPLHGPLDPDALILFFDNRALETCAAPVDPAPTSMPPCDPPVVFDQILLAIPPELDRPGLIDLSDLRILATENEWSPCIGGTGEGNRGFRGTLEIVSSDATSVSVKLRVAQPGSGPKGGLVSVGGWVDLSGDYTALRCGSAPPASPPIPAIAILGSKLPPPPSDTAPIDPTALYFFLGSATESCTDPWSSLTCTATSRTTFSLPAALQTTGTTNLSDPMLASTYAYSESKTTDCTAASDVVDTGTFSQGTLNVLSIDAGAASLQIYGSNTWTHDVFDADGLYTATICP